MATEKELKEILSDPQTDKAYFDKFAQIILEKFPEESIEDLKKKWAKLKLHAGLVDA